MNKGRKGEKISWVKYTSVTQKTHHLATSLYETNVLQEKPAAVTRVKMKWKKRGEATAAVEDDEKPHRTHTQMKKKEKKAFH